MAKKKEDTKKAEQTDEMKLVDVITAAHGGGAIMSMGDVPTKEWEVVSTGSLNLDKALGIGGLPKGRITEIFGPESSGKTTIALQVIAQAQKHGRTCAFVDAEHALDLKYAKALGVDMHKLLMAQPDYGEQALDIVERLVGSGLVDVVVVDSVAALVPKAELEGAVGDHHVGVQARMMSQAMRKLAGITRVTNTLVIFINQERSKIGVSFGSPTTTTGGNALKFYASVRLRIVRTGSNKVGDVAVSNKTKARVMKNKCAPPFREAEFEIEYGKGVSLAGEVLDYATDLKLITKSGSWYSLTETGERLGHGRENAKQCLIERPELLQTLLDEVRSQT